MFSGLGSKLVPILLAGLALSDCRPGAEDRVPRTLEGRLVHDTRYLPCLAQPGSAATTRPFCGRPLSEEQRASVRRRLERLPTTDGESRVQRAALLTSLYARRTGLASALAALKPGDDPVATGPEALAMSAVQHALALEENEPRRLLQALELATQAAEAQPGRPAGHFNRALILADLGLCRLAAEVFDRALELEGDRAWATETEARRLALPCLGGDSSPGQPGRVVEAELDALVRRWAEPGDPLGPTSTQDLIAASHDAIPDDGERLLLEAARELAQGSADPRFRKAIDALSNGRSHYAENDFETAYRYFKEALPELERYRGVLGTWCRIWSGATAVYEERLEEAELTLEPLIRSSVGVGGPQLFPGRAHWSTGVAHLRGGNLGAALDQFASARQTFERGGYEDHVGAIRTLEAETLAALGLLGESWRPRTMALGALQTPRPRYHLHNALIEGALASERMGTRRVTNALLAEALLVARELGDPAIIEVLLRQGDVAARREEFSSAWSRYRDAQARTLKLPEGSLRERLLSRAELGLWSLPVADGTEDLSALERLAEHFARAGPQWRQLAALSLKAKLLRGQGQHEEALDELDRAVEVIRSQQAPLTSGPYGPRYTESVRAIFDQRIEIALAQGKIREALVLLEESRRPEPGGSGQPVSLPGAADPRVYLVFAELTDSVVWWRLDGGTLAVGTVLGRGLQALRETATARAMDEAALAEASEDLLGWALHGINPGRPVVIVPDGVLHRLPFGAMRNPETGVRLIEERQMMIFLTLAAAVAPPPPPLVRPRAVVVAAPETDRQVLPALPPLPRAQAEAEAIAGLYPGAVTLTGASATAARVREALDGADVLHVAAHTVLAEQPAEDRLVLAGDVASNGPVKPDQLMTGLAAPQLVVLAGCSTQGDSATRAGGPSGLASAFTQQGAAATLATLWPVDDDELTGITTAFHRNWLGGITACQALRKAQLEAIASGAPVRTWAALQLLGDAPSPRTTPIQGGNPP